MGKDDDGLGMHAKHGQGFVGIGNSALRRGTVQERLEKCNGSSEKLLMEVMRKVASCLRSVEDDFEMSFKAICFGDSGQKKSCWRV